MVKFYTSPKMLDIVNMAGQGKVNVNSVTQHLSITKLFFML